MAARTWLATSPIANPGRTPALIDTDTVNAVMLVILVTCLHASTAAARYALRLPKPVRSRAFGEAVVVRADGEGTKVIQGAEVELGCGRDARLPSRVSGRPSEAPHTPQTRDSAHWMTRLRCRVVADGVDGDPGTGVPHANGTGTARSWARGRSAR